jgi:DNA-directed RNA polymerase I subunit RPA49
MAEKVTINVPENCEQEGCFLVSFSNGQLKPSATNQPKFTLYHKGGTASKKKKIMVAETDKMTYIGTNYDESSPTSSANLCKYYIGALDTKTGSMSVHRAELMHLRPYIPGKTELDLGEESPVKRERSEVQDEMVALFGSEKQKRAFAAYKRNRVGSEALETALASAVTHADTNLEIPETAAVQPMRGSGLAPPFNPQAQAPCDVYNISDIISLDDLRAVKMAGKVLTSASGEELAQWAEQATYPGYVLSHIPSIPSSEPERGLKAAMLLYCGWLIQMYTQNFRNFEKKGLQLSGERPSPDVEKNLLEKFSEPLPDTGRKHSKGPRRTITNKMRDKILLHLLVLTLVLDDYSVDCSVLQQDLKVTTKKLMENYRSLGCRVSKLGVKRRLGVDDGTVDTTSCSAVLRIPLEFPRPRKGRKK